MLFPADDLVRTFPRDCWLIDRYRPPSDSGLKNQPASMLPGGITYISDDLRKTAPKELIAEIDQAYFRQSLREEVNLWFTRCGFNRKQRTISKKDFEAALAKPSVTKRPAGKLTDEELLQLQPEFVKNYLAPYSANSAPRPTVTELRTKWRDAGHGARRRDELDEELKNQAKDKGILLKSGRQKKRAR
jgi:hypothetical protein